MHFHTLVFLLISLIVVSHVAAVDTHTTRALKPSKGGLTNAPMTVYGVNFHAGPAIR